MSISNDVKISAFGKTNCFTLISWSRTPLGIRKSCQTIRDILDHVKSQSVEKRTVGKMMIYKHTACIPRWKDVKRFASTSFQGWIDMLCLYKHCLTLKKETLTLMSTLICWYNVIIVLQTNWSISIHKFIIILLHFERVYIRPEMKSTRTEISTHHKRNFAYITFHCGRN